MHSMYLTEMTEEDAAQICQWRYPEPYDIFNWPAWEKMQKDGYEFGDPEIRMSQYASVRGNNEALIGFAQFFPMSGVVRLGLGLRPDLCGGGLGVSFARLIADTAGKRYPGFEIDLEVLAWNMRAMKAYAKAGFQITDTYERMTPNGVGLFHCMVFEGK